MNPVDIDVVSKVLTSYVQCGKCSLIFDKTGIQEKVRILDMKGYPEDLQEELARLSEWLRELLRLYKHRIHIRIVNAHSVLGIYKAIRHRISQYPCFIVGHRDTYVGWDKQKLEAIIDAHIRV